MFFLLFVCFGLETTSLLFLGRSTNTPCALPSACPFVHEPFEHAPLADHLSADTASVQVRLFPFLSSAFAATGRTRLTFLDQWGLKHVSAPRVSALDAVLWPTFVVELFLWWPTWRSLWHCWMLKKLLWRLKFIYYLEAKRWNFKLYKFAFVKKKKVSRFFSPSFMTSLVHHIHLSYKKEWQPFNI